MTYLIKVQRRGTAPDGDRTTDGRLKGSVDVNKIHSRQPPHRCNAHSNTTMDSIGTKVGIAKSIDSGIIL